MQGELPRGWFGEVPLMNRYSGWCWLLMSKLIKVKSYFLPLFKIIWLVDAMKLCLSKIKSAFCKTAIKPWKPIIEHILALNLASSSNSTSLLLFQRRTSPTSKVGSLWTSTSSLGFPGGSLGHPGTAGAGCLSVGLLGHIWILLFRTT